VGEALRVGDPATIVVGDRDAAFFTEGWTRPVADGNVTFRLATRPRAVVRTPLPVRDHTLLVRLDPFPRPRDQSPGALPTVRLSLNERLAATIPLLWNPARVGAYEVALPSAFVKEGLNDLVFETDTTGGAARGIRLWYVRLTPH
jgi:hypothetical protein